MNQKITLYHGSEQLVETPTFGLGKKNNDFGLGFYCTESEELAKEWAVSSLRNGFANRYSLDTEYLNIGYRADDSYFDYAESFLNNGISVQQLAKAMRLGKLGEQIVVKSKYAFSLLHYEGFSIAEKEKYYVLRKARNNEADQHYVSILEEETDGLYMLDILRGGIQNDDPRIPRNVSK